MLLLSIIIAVVFYLVLPGIGAVVVRARWRRFRNDVYHAASIPRAVYTDIRAVRDGSVKERECYFIGRLEALQGDNRIWLRDGNASVEVDMTDTNLIVLPPYKDSEQSLPPAHGIDFPSETPDVIPWRQVTSLTEGSAAFVSGILTSQEGNAVFARRETIRPLLLLYDGPSEHVLERAVWTGRQRNEYWSLITPLALLSGMFALSILSMRVLQASYTDGLLTLGLAAIPVLPLLPPGVPGYFLYRNLWRRGRAHRATRDGLRLMAVSNARPELNAAAIRRNQRKAVLFELAAVAVLLASVFLNYIVLVRVFALVL